MELYGEFQDWVDGWEVDRLGVHRITIARKYSDIFAEPKRNGSRIAVAVPWVRTTVSPDGDSGNGIIRYFHEGVPTDELENTPEVFDFEGTFNQEPITSHPKIASLLKSYRGRLVDGQVEWPARLSGGKANGGLNKAILTNSLNPMYGVDSYLAFGATWRRTKVYAEGKLPTNLLDGVGLIFDRPPGNPETPKRRNWLKLGPTSRQRGNVTEISDTYLLSGIGGWLPQVYDGSDL